MRAPRPLRARLLALALLIAAAIPLLTSCADCFFRVEGTLQDCATLSPLPAATIAVHIDDGLHGPRTLPEVFTTNAAGMFKVHTDGTEDCGATATLMFRLDGYQPLDMQIRGTPKSPIGLCMIPIGPP